MSKPVFKDLFKFEGRRNRKSFFLLHLAFSPIIAIFVYLLVIFAVIATYGTMSGDEASALLIFIPFLGPWAVWFVVTAQRCRDFGWTGWAALLTLIPFLGWFFWLALFFIPGTDGDNRYGPDPLKK